jgi:hypothetical protein
MAHLFAKFTSLRQVRSAASGFDSPPETNHFAAAHNLSFSVTEFADIFGSGEFLCERSSVSSFEDVN